jgi:vesicle coat complex subunit
MTTEYPQITLRMQDLLNALEPLIRRVVREELTTVRKNVVNTFYLDPDSPLYEDMEELYQRKAEGKIKLLSDEEVWDE